MGTPSLPLGEVFEDLPQLVVVAAGDPMRIRYANRAARSLLAGVDFLYRPVGQVIDSIPTSAVTPTGELAEPEPMIERVLDEERQVGPELRRFELPSGTRYLRIIAVPYRPDRLGGQGVVLCGEDVTSQVTFGESRRRFLEATAHQFRTPLTPIIGYASMILEGAVPPGQLEDAAREILDAALRLQGLFDRMTMLFRLEREAQPELEEATISEIMERTAKLDPTLLEPVELSGDPHTVVRCHPSSLSQVIFELLRNGRRFGQPPLTIRWEPGADAVLMRISDAGPGPEPGLLSEDLFDMANHQAKRYVMPRDMGFRLGLAHARVLAGLSGARLHFERDQRGWALVLTLPSAASTTLT